jgi:hypothetical protein
MKLMNLQGKRTKQTDITTVAKILSQFDFNKLIDNELFSMTAQVIYNNFPKNAIEDDERFWVYSFIHEGMIATKGKLKDGMEYYLTYPKEARAKITRIRVNKGVWLEWRLMQGFKHKEAIEEWCRLYYTYGSSGSIDSLDAFHAVLDEISNRPTLTSVPDLAGLLTDKLITICLWNLTSKGVSIDEWTQELRYSMIKKGISDDAAKSMIKVITDEWPLSQVIVPNTDMPHKAERSILPFTDGTIYSKALPEPYLSLSELDFRPAVDEESDRKNYEVVHLKTLNACADGSTNANYLMLNRMIGPISALPGDGRISQISITAVYPWVLGIQEPPDSNTRLEKRHWYLVYIYAKFDAPPVAAESFIEADLIGLKSFLGPNYYLFKPEEFTGRNNEEGITAYTGTGDNVQASEVFAYLYEPVEIRSKNADAT